MIMKSQYYLINLEGYGEIRLGLISSETFKSVKAMPARKDPSAIVLKLYRQYDEDSVEGLVPISCLDISEIPEKQRLQIKGTLIEAGYPWGSQFIDGLDHLVNAFDLETYHDPFKEGSDSYGVIVGRSDSIWEVSPLLDERAEYCDENPDDEDAPWTMEDKIVEACRENSVIWLDTDWKHFEIDLTDFQILGLKAEYLEPVILSQPETLKIDEVQLLDDKGYVTINIQFIPL